MLAQLPLELIDRVIECLSFDDVRAIACVCSALHPPAQRRLFRTISISGLVNTGDPTPTRTEIILSQPNLLRCASRLIGEDNLLRLAHFQRKISLHSLWPHLPTMYRLTYVELCLERSTYAMALSSLEGLGLAREIELNLRNWLPLGLIISDKPLPVHSLTIPVYAAGNQLTRQLFQKCSQSLRKLHLDLFMNSIPHIPPLPYLCELSLHAKLKSPGHELTPWFPFLDQHPAITRLSIDPVYTLSVPPPPNVLPNLQSLKANTVVSERLIPGRRIHGVHVEYYSDQFPVDIMFQVLRSSNVPLTILEITTSAIFPGEGLINLLQNLPKLLDFMLEKPRYEVCQTIQGDGCSNLTINSPLSSLAASCQPLGDARTCAISDYSSMPLYPFPTGAK